MISEKIKEQINAAMKAKEEIKLSTLRMLAAELHNAVIDKKEKLDEAEELKIIKKEAKKRLDAIEAFEKAGRQDRVDVEKQELEVLQEFLPEEISDEELDKIVNEAVSEMNASMADMGKVIGAVMAKAKGQVDGSRVAAMVKEKLTS